MQRCEPCHCYFRFSSFRKAFFLNFLCVHANSFVVSWNVLYDMCHQSLFWDDTDVACWITKAESRWRPAWTIPWAESWRQTPSKSSKLASPQMIITSTFWDWGAFEDSRLRDDWRPLGYELRDQICNLRAIEIHAVAKYSLPRDEGHDHWRRSNHVRNDTWKLYDTRLRDFPYRYCSRLHLWMYPILLW